ncbi:Sterile alpha and TIR motif-containing protein 1 [Nymphon striatum]|nr:Sterile alpha and TIR motif-containing protein 1 [Nymphon striatum]
MVRSSPSSYYTSNAVWSRSTYEPMESRNGERISDPPAAESKPTDSVKKKSDTMATNGSEASSFVDNIRDKKAAFLNKLNSSSISSSQVTKSSSSSRTLHTMSSQEENRASNFSRSISLSSDSSKVKLNSASGQRKYSVDHLKDMEDDPVPIVSEPDSPQPSTASPSLACKSPLLQTQQHSPSGTLIDHKQMLKDSRLKLKTNDFTAEKVAGVSKEMKRMQSADVNFEEKKRMGAFKQKLESENFNCEKVSALKQEQKQLVTADMFKQSQKSAGEASTKMSSATDEYSAQKMALSQEERQMISSTQGVMHEQHIASTSSSKLTYMSKSASASSSSLSSTQNMKSLESAAANVASGLSMLNGSLMEGFALGSPNKLSITQESPDDDLDRIDSFSESNTVNSALHRCNRKMASCVEKLKNVSEAEAIPVLENMSDLILRAWAVHTHGHDLGYSLCNVIRNNGGLDILINNCSSETKDLQFMSAKVLEQCLTTENRAYVVENGLDKVVRAACADRRNRVAHSRVGSGILEHLFKHSEGACGEVIQLGGLNAILYDCRSSDIETLRHCAAALANLSLYGGSENQQSMIESKAPVWLFPLAFNNDDNIKYYACLAIAALVANKELEAAVIRSGTLNLVEPFVTCHSPKEFAASSASHVHGQSKTWLQRLVHVLNSKREEARNLAAFHFAMEAGIKQKQGNTKVFHEIGAVDALKKVASSPNAIASKYAAQALRLIGEDVPHKLSQQVPLWTVEDVTEWVKQIGFGVNSKQFFESRVDGDLLLQMDEENLREDILIKNGILRKRFMRELNLLKIMADYSSCDSENIHSTLHGIHPELCRYTYNMIKSNVSSEMIPHLIDDQLKKECGIDNSIHRIRVLESVRSGTQVIDTATGQASTNLDKNLDVFISYRRSNGSQLASLLKVHLQLRGFSVFIDVERLEAGKFDNNLLQSIRQAKNFILVLTPNALDRCVGDVDCKDWVHREILAALESKCNIIPIIDNFQWPESDKLPGDMSAVCYFNGVRWIHDYQDACVDKLERFLRGETTKGDGQGRYAGAMTPGTPSSTHGGRGAGGTFQRSTSHDNTSDKESNGSSHPSLNSHT